MGPSPSSIGPGDRVTLAYQQLVSLHETVIRAMRAAMQAERLCIAAAEAFRAEALNLRAAGDALMLVTPST